MKETTCSVVVSEILFSQCSGGAGRSVVADPLALKNSIEVVNLTTGQRRGWSKVVRCFGILLEMRCATGIAVCAEWHFAAILAS